MDNTGLQEVGLGGMDYNFQAQDRDRWRTFANVVMNLRGPLNAGNLLPRRGHFTWSGRTLLNVVLWR